MVVLYKHTTEPDSAWQYIHANSYKHAEAIANALHEWHKPAEKPVRVAESTTQTRSAPKPFVVLPRVVSRLRGGDESMYLAEPPWNVVGPRIIHSGHCGSFNTPHRRAARMCRVCLGPDLLTCGLDYWQDEE